ncbi:MAG: CCA tRNA nucleotidyltransferase [Nitrososphaeria archaeon]
MSFSLKIDERKVDEVVAEVKKVELPSEELRSRLRSVVEELSERLRRNGLEFVLGGSYARDTWLPEDQDVDFFILYDPSLGPDGIAKKGLEDIKRAIDGLPYWERYAEHPYIEGSLDGVKFNIVPCARTEKGKWITAMDRSRYHNEYLLARLNDELRSEIRVFKRFLRSNGVYGAEIKVGGFSGYVTEILIVKYGSFKRALLEIVNWKKGDVIALEPYSYDPRRIFDTEVIILDPVDEKRNLASAIRKSTLAKIKILALRFLLNPSLSYFERTTSPSALDIGGHVLMVSLRAPDAVDDIKWGMYYRAQQNMINILRQYGFSVIRSTISENEGWVSFAFFLERTRREFDLRTGPQVYMVDNSLQFLSKHRVVWAGDDMRLYSFESAKFQDASEVISKIKESPANNGIPEGLIKSFEIGSAVYYFSDLDPGSPYARSAKEAYTSLFESLNSP